MEARNLWLDTLKGPQRVQRDKHSYEEAQT